MKKQSSYENRRKLKELHKIWLTEHIDKMKGQHFTLNTLQRDIINNFHDLGEVSESTIRRVLKNLLHFRFKKLEKIEQKTTTAEHIRVFFETAAIIMKLEDKSVETIYFDEFSINSRRVNFYGWWKIGEKSALALRSNPFSMSFVIAVSQFRVYGIMGSGGSMTSDSMIHFLKKLCEERNQNELFKQRPFVFWFDNASIHTSSKLQSFMRQADMKAITIAPYWPMLNPWEKVILALKWKLKTYYKSNK